MLSEQKIELTDPAAFIYKGQRLETFFLPYWLGSKGIWGKISAISQARRLLEGIKVNKSFGLHQIKEAIEFYKANMTDGKVFLRPSLTE
jgi:hypothetical protein